MKLKITTLGTKIIDVQNSNLELGVDIIRHAVDGLTPDSIQDKIREEIIAYVEKAINIPFGENDVSETICSIETLEDDVMIAEW